MFLVALGAIVLAALLFALSMVSQDRKDFDPPKKPTPGTAAVDPGKGKTIAPKPMDPPISATAIHNETDLRHRLERGVEGDIVTLDEDLVLNGGLKIAR